MLRRFAFLLFALTLAACDGGEGEGPYFEFAGGGFVFNYRYADATYGFVAQHDIRAAGRFAPAAAATSSRPRR